MRLTKNHFGFTLVELLVVVVIITLVGLIAIPNLSPANARLRQAARDLYANLQKARVEAIKSNQNVGIIFDTTANRYTVCKNINVNNNCTDAVGADGINSETVLATVDLNTYGSDVRYGCGAATQSLPGTACPPNGVSYPSNITAFSPRGTLSSGLGYAYLQNNKNSTFVVGTPTMAGVVVSKQWANNSWQ